jgi:hypothetical protein
MHNCQDFREQITEQILDREDLDRDAALRHELLMCTSCADFYAQSWEMMEALDGIDLSISDNQWKGIEHRLNARIINAATVIPEVDTQLDFVAAPRLQPAFAGRFGLLLATAAVLLLTVGLARVPIPGASVAVPEEPATAVYVEQSLPLDPVTIEFFGDSELLLRTVMNLEPGNADDLADAKQVAREQLVELKQRKEAVAEVPLVVSVIDTYETILRDIRNVDERSVDDDISDIRQRIQQNGLIANMKAFQPRVTEVGFSLQ